MTGPVKSGLGRQVSSGHSASRQFPSGQNAARLIMADSSGHVLSIPVAARRFRSCLVRFGFTAPLIPRPCERA